MRMIATLFAGTAACLAVNSVALGALTVRESDDFINRADDGSTAHYEANVIPQNATPSWGSPGTTQTYGVSNGELTLTTETTGDRSFYDQTGSFWPGDADRATGYTVEFQMRIDDIIDLARGPVLVRIADGTQQVELEWRSDAIVWNGTSMTFNHAGYHTYRVAYDPSANDGAGAYAAWIDDTLISDSLTGAATTTDHLLFGDTSTSRYGGTTTWNYVRWDTTGAYAPIPEPASLALLTAGGLLLARRRLA